MTATSGLLPDLLRVATAEARRQGDHALAPRSLFAGLFDVAFGVAPAQNEIADLDAFAARVLETVGTPFSLVGLARALVESQTHVGKVLREQDTEATARTMPQMSADVDVRNFLAPELGHPLPTGGLIDLGDAQLTERAAASFRLARQRLAELGVDVTVISSHRTMKEQAEGFAAITSTVVDRRNFPVGRPGQSLHEVGLALDLAYTGYTQIFRAEAGPEHVAVRAVREVMRLHGWFQFDRTNDPVHFSFGRIG